MQAIKNYEVRRDLEYGRASVPHLLADFASRGDIF
jgi:hypothetical protein